MNAGQTEVQAAEVTVTTGIQNRMPVDAVKSYAASVESLYCYCRILGVGSETTVWHVWYHNDREVARGFSAGALVELENLVEKGLSQQQGAVPGAWMFWTVRGWFLVPLGFNLL